MSELVGGRRSLASWNAALAEQRADLARARDAWISAWTWVLLVATMLYVLIGSNPYQHDAVFDPLTGGSVISPVNRVIWLALLAFAAPVLWWRRADLVDAARRLWPLALLFVWFIATTRWATDPDASSRRLFLYIVDLLICLAVSLGLKDPRRLHSGLAVACAIVVVIDLGSWIVAPAASMTDIGLAAIHTHKNTLGAVMLLTGMICAPYALAQQGLMGRMFWGSVTIASFVLLIASRSKTSLGILVAAAIVGPLLIVLLKRRAEVVWGLGASALALLMASALMWLAWCAMQGQDPLAPVEKLTFTQRTDVWRFTVDQFRLHPWRGVGFGSFWDVDPKVQPSLQTDLWFAQQDAPTNESHNGYLDLLVTTGIPGLIGALLLLFRWMGRGLALLRRALLDPLGGEGRALPYLVYLGFFPLVFVVHNFMESTYFNPNSLFGFIILLVGVDIDMRHVAPSSITPAVARRGS
jgi:exopolysaccharide production protein ExoQ